MTRQSYETARAIFADWGVDTEAAMQRLTHIPISMHCWQGDDVVGFEAKSGVSGGGIQATPQVQPGVPPLGGACVHRRGLGLRRFTHGNANSRPRPDDPRVLLRGRGGRLRPPPRHPHKRRAGAL